MHPLRPQAILRAVPVGFNPHKTKHHETDRGEREHNQFEKAVQLRIPSEKRVVGEEVFAREVNWGWLKGGEVEGSRFIMSGSIFEPVALSRLILNLTGVTVTLIRGARAVIRS